MKYLMATEWTEQDAFSVARLIVEPSTNGGSVSDLTPEAVMEQLDPHTHALAAFHQGRAVFVVGLWPYDATEKRGILHVAGTGEMRNGAAVVRSFMDTLPDVEILTFTDRPALARLAQRAGLRIIGSQGGYIILERARAQSAAPSMKE